MGKVFHRFKGGKMMLVENFSPGIVSLRMKYLSVIDLSVNLTRYDPH